jgi:hypothetical protein
MLERERKERNDWSSVPSPNKQTNKLATLIQRAKTACVGNSPDAPGDPPTPELQSNPAA